MAEPHATSTTRPLATPVRSTRTGELMLMTLGGPAHAASWQLQPVDCTQGWMMWSVPRGTPSVPPSLQPHTSRAPSLVTAALCTPPAATATTPSSAWLAGMVCWLGLIMPNCMTGAASSSATHAMGPRGGRSGAMGGVVGRPTASAYSGGKGVPGARPVDCAKSWSRKGSRQPPLAIICVLPSWPSQAAPQPYTRPPSSSARLCVGPVATARSVLRAAFQVGMPAVLRLILTVQGRGVRDATSSCLPVTPSWPPPQLSNSPVPSSANAWLPLADSCATFWPASSGMGAGLLESPARPSCPSAAPAPQE
mmetsp:Transcript_12369/g.30360  ORF Transcript_12369/g.30360 Transcript_12369/m.30360 type:complete len:308 (-) Transcript_12369:875-1798(-)